MTAPEPDGIVWRTSSYSNGAAACVEVGWYTGCDGSGVAAGRVLVRDSKDRAAPALAFSTPAWRAFLATLVP
ncbi:MAG: DUF397 domain-containing protein [Pseudonocardia sp.]